MESENRTPTSWLDRPLAEFLPRLNIETLLVVIILLLAVVSRFYDVGLRVMSHDEVNHMVPSFDYYSGRGYRYDPVTHGPLQFHLIAGSFFLLGDNDFSARVPAVLFGIAAIAVVLFAYRRYLGRTGALIAGFLFLISPYMLFYSRYARNEVFIVLWAVLTLYSVLRYLEKGDLFSLFLLTITTALHFTDKATSYIFTAQILIFLAFVFLNNITRLHWPTSSQRTRFIGMMILALALVGLALGLAVYNSTLPKPAAAPAAAPGAAPTVPTPQPGFLEQLGPVGIGEVAAVVAALGFGLAAVFIVIRSLGWAAVRKQRSFELILVLMTLILPLLSPIPVKLLRWDPLDYSPTGILHSAIFIVLFAIVGVLVGLWWNRRIWLQLAVIFYTIFGVLYTSLFTNSDGFFAGMVGALGYWMAQQGVQRGSQPWYFYALIQIPMYEYLAALGTLLALYLGIRHNKLSTIPGDSPAYEPLPLPVETAPALDETGGDTPVEVEAVEDAPQTVPTLWLLLYWSLINLISFSIAGEKMPWLTTHIAAPMLLASGWALGYLVDTTPWKKIANRQGLLALLLTPVFIASLLGLLGSVLGDKLPFQGKTLEQLQATSQFLISLIATGLSGWGILHFLRDWYLSHITRLVALAFFGLLALLTARAAYTAAYINYDRATEFLVYAHAARGPKDVLAQIDEISRRITRGTDLEVSYDNDGLYPYWWYLRHYPNHRWFTDKPSRDLRNSPIVVAGEANYGKVDPILKDEFVSFEYMRLWWPMQDYFGLTGERVWNAVKDPKMRAAIFDIWLNRDYSAYAQLTGSQTLTLENWQPSNRMKLYIRKDVIAQMWNYGSAPVMPAADTVDPYEKGMLKLAPDRVVLPLNEQVGMLQAPRGVAVGPDGTLYVADSRNHRIVHLKPSGDVLNVWGTFGDSAKGEVPGGQFNEPWGVAVGTDGSVYVTDTWNHRIQKFTADGTFVKMWGRFGQAETPDALWGPRGIVATKDRLFVTDTGNKRIVVFDLEGNPITSFGEVGTALGEMDEPVGLAVDANGRVFVADTWNQRVQVFVPNENGTLYTAVQEWPVAGWLGESLDNKPFLAVDDRSHVFVADPEGLRLLEFDADGKFIQGWGGPAEGFDGVSLVAGVIADPVNGGVWVSDAGNNRLLHFTLPLPK